MGRHALLGIEASDASDILAVQLGHRVGAHRRGHVLGLPAEDLPVELLGGGNVGGRQRVRCVPYSTGGTYGDLWLAPALAQFSPGSNFVSKSTDGGVSWEAISRANGSNIDLTSPVDIGYGKPETVGGYSTMWAYAYGNNGSGALLGFWRSTDGGVTWIELNP